MINPDVQFASIIGALPTVSMLVASVILYKLKISSIVEACFQNFCAGLILAAVAAELFPLIATSATVTQADSIGGITCGFILGIAMINGVEIIVGKFENADTGTATKTYSESSLFLGLSLSSITTRVDETLFTNNNVTSSPMHGDSSAGIDGRSMMTTKNGGGGGGGGLHEKAAAVEDLESADVIIDGDGAYGDGDAGEWEYAPVQNAVVAIACPEHRAHIETHFQEALKSIDGIQKRFTDLVKESEANHLLSSEQISEEIDENVHQLQYTLDHIRRLMQGSFAPAVGSSPSDGTLPWWTDPLRKARLDTSLQDLKGICTHLVDHIHQPQITVPVIREMHQHVDEMQKQIDSLHVITEEVAFKWRRRAKRLPDPLPGSLIPPSLIVPVTIDGMVDGLMIGVSCALSRKAGLVLGCANCLEMAFLGMAVSVRVRKCTGSSLLTRYLSMVIPPCVMFLATLIGAAMGSAAKSVPCVFVTFVSFGVVALLFLVCNELLVEARRAHEEDEKWWITAVVFMGIWVVMVMGSIEDGLTK